MPLQAGTQWDAIAHVAYDGFSYNGRADTSVSAAGASFAGIEQIARAGGIVGRGVLLDVAGARGAAQLDPREVIQPDDLVAVASRQGVELGEGDVLLIRTGWRRKFLETGHDGWALDSPGLGWRCAEWMHDVGVAAVACDNIAVEVIISEIPDVALPFHMLALRDMGMPLGELWDFEELAADCATDQVYEFMLAAPALRFTMGLGTPVNPVAIK
jgi:kynurenine formamidase